MVEVVVYVIVVVELTVTTWGVLHEEDKTVVVEVTVAFGPEATVPVGTTVFTKPAQKELAKGAGRSSRKTPAQCTSKVWSARGRATRARRAERK
jgi:hypothetical protein